MLPATLRNCLSSSCASVPCAILLSQRLGQLLPSSSISQRCEFHSCTKALVNSGASSRPESLPFSPCQMSSSASAASGLAGWLLQTKNRAAAIAARPDPLAESSTRSSLSSEQEQSVKTIASLLLTDDPRYVAHLILRVFKQRQSSSHDSVHQILIHPAEEAAALSMLSSPEIKQLKARLEAAYAARTEAAEQQRGCC